MNREINPQVYARVGGVLYLIIIAIGAWGEGFVRGRLLSRDPATTAANIKAVVSLWRFHVAAELFLLSCAIVLLLILYVLLRPVHRDLALLAALFNIVSISVEAVSALGLDLAPNQSPEMTKVLIRLHDHGFGVSLLFFGWFCVTIGYLIFKSQYLPKAIGVLMQIAGVCYLINSFAFIASPQVANRLFPAILIPVVHRRAVARAVAHRERHHSAARND